ncbi:MAG: hypothetical protein QOF41_1217 [Methylobacteriaceae bacterium]|jgi:hypothetical protein|nr:hypothetical protein [Methylobacteriaceae bacterium]
MPENLWTFLLLTCVLGGAAAFATGRAIALTWRPFWQALAYTIPLAAAVRFLHYALFGEDILALGPALLAFVILLAVAAIAFRIRQVQQMVGQYPFAFVAAGPFAWRARGDEEPR